MSKLDFDNSRPGKLTRKEFNKRCYEIFDPMPDDEFYTINVFPDGSVYIQMSEVDEDEDERITFDFSPDMSERPTALAYLMGDRDDFED